jgi:hypothetical protein
VSFEGEVELIGNCINKLDGYVKSINPKGVTASYNLLILASNTTIGRMERY